MSDVQAGGEATDKIQIGDIEISGLTAQEKAVFDLLASGASLKDIRGLSDQDLETVYAVGFNLYNQGKYEQAEPMFEYGCLYANTEARYWMALGNCRQMLKKYQAAIDAFGFAYLFDSDNPWPVVQTAVCYLALGDKGQAKESLDLADQTIDMAQPDPAARQRIAALRQAL
jgi:type III secretion system low calcium response chaperone LcrH/SycD